MIGTSVARAASIRETVPIAGRNREAGAVAVNRPHHRSEHVVMGRFSARLSFPALPIIGVLLTSQLVPRFVRALMVTN